MKAPVALIAEDEPLLAAHLQKELARAWPELHIGTIVADGLSAAREALAHRPDVCFLDIRMPGCTGLETAQAMAEDWPEGVPFPLLVFVTAYDQYAVQAFAQGVLDYLVKPVEPLRLAETVARLKERLEHDARPAVDTDALLRELAAQLQRGGAPETLRWIRASVGQTLRLISVDDVDFLRSDEKYTLIAWHDDAGEAREAVIRTPLKGLVAQLDTAQFAQVHRSVVVNLRSVAHVTRGANETANIHLKGRVEVLPVSRTYLHLFRQM
jgi:DNA-binding LytR/AlgR family response regulator